MIHDPVHRSALVFVFRVGLEVDHKGIPTVHLFYADELGCKLFLKQIDVARDEIFILFFWGTLLALIQVSPLTLLMLFVLTVPFPFRCRAAVDLAQFLITIIGVGEIGLAVFLDDIALGIKFVERRLAIKFEYLVALPRALGGFARALDDLLPCQAVGFFRSNSRLAKQGVGKQRLAKRGNR